MSENSQQPYQVQNDELHLFHVKIEDVQFDRKTGKKESNSQIMKYDRKMFMSFIKRNLELEGNEVTILHNPINYEKKLASDKAAKIELQSIERVKQDKAVAKERAEQAEIAAKERAEQTSLMAEMKKTLDAQAKEIAKLQGKKVSK